MTSRDKVHISHGDTHAIICAKGVTLMHQRKDGIFDRFAVFGRSSLQPRRAGVDRGSRRQRRGGGER